MIVEHEGKMGSVYPFTESYYSFLVKDEEAKQSGDYRVVVDWNYKGKTFTKELTYNIKGEDVEQANDVIVVEEKDTPKGIYITKGDLIKYSIIALSAIIAVAIAILFYIRRIRK